MLLGLLAHAQDRTAIIELLAQRGFGLSDALQWLKQLIQPIANDGVELLGIEVDPDDTPGGHEFRGRIGELLLFVIETMTMGASTHEVVEALTQNYPDELSTDVASQLVEEWQPLRSTFLRPLVAEQAASHSG